MNKVEALLNRIELVAKKLEMSVDDVIQILEGKHPTHVVAQKYQEIAPAPTPAPPPPFVAAQAANSPDPTLTGHADASASVVGQQAAGSTESSGEDDEEHDE